MTPIEEPEAMQLSQKRTVACVLKSGGTASYTSLAREPPGAATGPYSAEYVWRLRQGLARHTPGFQLDGTEATTAPLVCLTDDRRLVERGSVGGVRFEPLEHDWPGWWAKMALFRLEGPILYLDLDTVITGAVTPLLEYAGNLAILRDFNIREHGGLPAIGSAVLLWTAGAMRPVWDAFIADPERAIREHPKRADHFIRKHLPPCDYVQDLWPGLVACAKDGFRGWLPGPPAGARIICTWGKPRIPELPATHWYRRLWEEE
jgi:hypothetical protein